MHEKEEWRKEREVKRGKNDLCGSGAIKFAVPGVIWVQALLIHGVDCKRGVGTLLAAARSLRVGECTVCGMQWLLGAGRRWGKRLSWVVVYLDHPVVVRGNSVWYSILWSAMSLGGER